MGYGAIKIKNKKVNNFGIVGTVFECRIQLFENFCHQRSQEVTRGQSRSNGGQKSKMKKVNTMGIVGKVFNCRIQLFENFCH